MQKIIGQTTNVNTLNNRGDTALLLACNSAQAESVKLLLDNGADPNISDANDYTCLHAAVRGHCINVTLQEIITHHAHLDARDSDGATALFLACASREQNLVKVFLEAGSDPNRADNEGITCLQAAVAAGCSKNIIRAIINHGAYVNATAISNEPALMIAYEKGDVNTISVLLDSAADPNIINANGNTCLHIAALNHCRKEMLQAIIEHGAEVNATNMNNETALMKACEKGNTNAIYVLLDGGADPNIVDADGDTCLHYAVRKDCCTEVVQAIVSHGVEVNATNKKNVTALMLTCLTGNIDTINLLLSTKANPHILDANGYTWLHYAAYGDCNKEVLHAVICHSSDVNETNKYNQTALIIACGKGNKDEVNVLLNAGADPNVSDVDGNTCLHYTARNNYCTDVLQTIITHCIDVNATNKNNVTALMIACGIGNKEAINVLLNAGADCNIFDADGLAWLHYAACGDCRKEVIQTIINHGTDINTRDKNNRTALMIACQKGKRDAIKVLLNAGADLNFADVSVLMKTCDEENVHIINVLLNAGADPKMADDNGDTWIHYAAYWNCCKEYLWSIDHGADVNAKNNANLTPLMIACEKGNIDTINVLLNAGADTNIADCEGATCIHYAVYADCSTDVLQEIICHSACVNATNKYNQTALILGYVNGNHDAINVLLKAGAYPNIADNDGDTCLHVAVTEDCSKEVLQALINRGADVNATNKTNATPLMIACKKASMESINVLLNAGADPNISGTSCFRCLHDAVTLGHKKEILQVLINHGADVNAANTNNETVLMTACWIKNIDAINLLLEAGADPNIAGANGFRCLHDAVTKGSSIEVLLAIINHGADINATNMNNETALMIACQMENKDTINALLSAGADPNVTDSNGDTCLCCAARNDCCTEVLQVIISHGGDVNATGKDNRPALMIACKKGNKDATNLLLSAGADPNLPDGNGATCIHYAVCEGCCKDMLSTVVNHGADINATSNKNVTSLMLACEKGNMDAINVLLNAGADPNIADAEGDACLQYAARNDCCTEIVQAIISRCVDINATNKNNITALMMVCEKINKNAINVLLNAGADPNITDADGDICLHSAARNNCCTEVLQAILSHGGDVNATGKEKRTALMIACKKGNKQAINVLFNAGADPNIVDADREACLHYAAQNYCCTEIFQAIITHGGDVNVTGKYSRTALTIACEKGNKDAINVLVNGGADPNTIVDAYGETCLHYAVKNDLCTEILQAIITHSRYVNATGKYNRTALMIACEKGNKDAINVLVNAGADPNIVNADGETCLHYAALCDSDGGVLQALISHGADVNATKRNNVTALMLASEKENKDAINSLLNGGADPNIADADSETCIHSAARHDFCTEILHAIISHGGDVNAKGKYSRTALMIACEKGNKDAINVLVNAGGDPNIVYADGEICLHYAVRKNCCTEILQAIISHGGDVNAKVKYSRTALMIACEKGNKDAINVLVNAGADPNIVDADGEVCLHYAVRNNCCTEILHAIISHGADVNATGKDNRTALMIACEREQKEAINALLNAGADPNTADAHGCACLHIAAAVFHRNDNYCECEDYPVGDTCLHYAARNDCCTEILQTVISHGGDVNATDKSNRTALLIACKKGNKDAIKVLLNAAADPNIVDADREACLHYAAQNYCCTEILQAIISHGGDVNATGKNNRTALLIACLKRKKDAINALLNGGADPNITDAYGETCIHSAARHDFCTEILQVIISHGGDVNAKGKYSRTALMIACEKGNKDALNVLVNAGADPNIVDADRETCLHYAAQK